MSYTFLGEATGTSDRKMFLMLAWAYVAVIEAIKGQPAWLAYYWRYFLSDAGSLPFATVGP
jgi:hypothetical protein